MVDRDIALAKASIIERCLARIADIRGRAADQDAIDATDLNLLRAIQAAIDLAAHVVADEGYGLPDTVAGHFTLLEKAGLLDAALAERLRKMVGFRNVLVHAYQDVDRAIVESIVARHLDDLRRFAAAIARRFLAA